ncbi:glycosyltransferase [Kocuria carniphila]|uniref:glycosyltransferase n=1 Tax=Kocuria carniphila TaxID=262208 RepID=UPI0034CE3EE5
MQQSSVRSLVDVVIPVHSLSRPLGRAVDSARLGVQPLSAGEYVITVVAHHLSTEQVRGMLTQEQLDHVRIIEAPAEGATAAAPRTAGLEHTNAKYICFLDSDDSYQPGAVGRWVKIAEKRHSDMVIPWLKHSNGRTDITPVIRPGRTSNLDPIADRLVYRASVFGLQRVETVRRLGAEFEFGTSTGEDQAFTLRLYVGAARIDYAPGEPTYVMHADAIDRVSKTPSPVRTQLEPAVRILSKPWFEGIALELRRAFVVKVIRINMFEAVTAHLGAGTWTSDEAHGTKEVLTTLLGAVPRARGDLSRADLRLIDLLLAGATEQGALQTALTERRRFASPAALLTANPVHVMGRDAPVRFMAAATAQMARDRLAKRRGGK